MAVPKKKISPSRRNMRRSHHRLTRAGLCRVPELRRAEAAAHVCDACGYYGGREVVLGRPAEQLNPMGRPRRAAVSAHVTIALDAMGGDQAPKSSCSGADIALERYPGGAFCCSASRLRSALARQATARSRKVAELHHTDDVVGPTTSRRSASATGRRKSSMRLAIEAVADGRADCVVSAGNTGALMAMAKFVAEDAAGHRPAGARDVLADACAARP